MSLETSNLSPVMGDGFLPAMLAWQSACTAAALQAQQEQLKLLSTWQSTVSAIQQDWWDGWIARFGGGVPLDA